MKSLVIVDMQRDFVDKGGVLYFPKAEDIKDNIIKKIEEYEKMELPIITTQDWHDMEDREFKKFPPHCIKGSYGARLTSRIEDVLKDYNSHFSIKKKRFSAFFETSLEDILKEAGINEVEVCGVITHICVLYTVEGFRNRDIQTSVLEQGVASFDKAAHECALKFMKEVLGAQIV
ncbi:MAG: cysteine hydrolase [Thermotoga sp.]|nr:MAG: cysteine hydrolase [Thermotoga sp.]